MRPSMLFQELTSVIRSRKGPNRREPQVTDVALLAGNSPGRLENSLLLQGSSNLIGKHADLGNI